MAGQSPKNERLERAKDRVAEAAIEKHAEAHKADKTIDAAMRIGAVGAMTIIAEKFSAHINASAVRALTHFADAGLYRQFGFDRFDDFLSKSPYAPMSRSQYYERKALLEREGDTAFDVLNSLRVPASARKLLAQGNVAVEGEEIVIGDARIPATDRDAVLEVINTLAAGKKKLEATIERGKETVKELKKKVAGGTLAGLLGSNPHDDALNLALVALSGLRAQAAGLSVEEAASVRDNAMRLLGGAWAELREAYGFGDDEAAAFARDSVGDDEVAGMFS